MAGQQQVGHGSQIHLVGLDAPLAACPPLPGHMRGVQLHDLPVGWQHAGGQQRTVVMASRLDPDPDQVDPTLGADCLDPSGELGHPGPVHRELQRAHQQLTSEVAHQRHRRGLADIDRDGEQLLGWETAGRGRKPLHLSAMDVHHEHTTSGVCGES
jgi:hypothetical protein